MTARVLLRPGREKSALNRHPWIFAGAIQRVENDPQGGELVSVHDSRGQFLAWGHINRQSQIAVRLFSWEQDEQIDDAFWLARLERSIASRVHLAASETQTNAYRLAYAEADGLPGLVVDRYGDWLVIQLLTAGMDVRRELLVDLLREVVPSARGIVERSDVDVREKEGLATQVGLLWGESPPAELQIVENGLAFQVDLMRGHKTGFYLDQRENRRILETYAAGAEVLNCFAYTGAFSVYAARGQAARLINVETSNDALAWAQQNLALNGYADRPLEQIEVDVFQQLRRFRDSARQFDVIILDPPKFAHSQRQVQKAARGYKDINWLAMRLLRPGGHLFSFSCSGAIGADLFQKILFGAALDAGREVRIVRRLTQGDDHPVALTFPEADYLKGVVCQVW